MKYHVPNLIHLRTPSVHQRMSCSDEVHAYTKNVLAGNARSTRSCRASTITRTAEALVRLGRRKQSPHAAIEKQERETGSMYVGRIVVSRFIDDLTKALGVD